MANVVMPQMGESIAEGTIVRWIKKVGDAVDRDEPLFEISTDKVDAEIPAPAAGVLTAINVKEGETVPVNSVVAVIGTPGEAKDAAPETAKPPAPTASGLPEAAAGQPEVTTSAGSGSPRASSRVEASSGADETADESLEDGDDEISKEDLRRQRSSPLVRR